MALHLRSMQSIERFVETYQVNHFDLDDALLQSNELLLKPGLHYKHEQYRKPSHWDFENSGLLFYSGLKNNEQHIQLHYFLVEQNMKPSNLNFKNEDEITFDIISVKFDESYLSDFAHDDLFETGGDKLLSFKLQDTFTKQLALCHKTDQVLQSIKSQSYKHALQKLFLQSQMQLLLLFGLEDCLQVEKEEHIVCKFLANDVDKDKIFKARDLLLQHLGNPITIKELSKKVAMNECYLKKGFKEVIGSTIFEFFQHERMLYARRLLSEKGLNVTEVADLLGYSSISHFSTAFKKHTGLKPCELLFG